MSEYADSYAAATFLAQASPAPWTSGARRYDVFDGPKVFGAFLEFSLRVTENGIPLVQSNPHRVFNAPVLGPDPTLAFRAVVEEVT